jgi:hypothetical protein
MARLARGSAHPASLPHVHVEVEVRVDGLRVIKP